MLLVLAYGGVHYLGWIKPLFSIADIITIDVSLLIGLVATLAAFALSICTAMIYASLPFLQEWHSPHTIVNYTLLGVPSGYMFAAAFSALTGVELVAAYGSGAVIFMALASLFRIWTLVRNRGLKNKSNLQTAIGVRQNQIVQKSQGAMGGSFNTREFFHGRSTRAMTAIRFLFLVLVFPLPIVLLAIAYRANSETLPMAAFVIQYIGL